MARDYLESNIKLFKGLKFQTKRTINILTRRIHIVSYVQIQRNYILELLKITDQANPECLS